ncbi:DUF5702 domain-containing protein [Acidaminobacter sp.]|uniref:DUF5702 domain-containing protein n=1 Tax=Acidaminobacter sp. TaxID=1872102 RepID=UPI0013852402|nr:DUF5702 domain-containing protein [Acidaminobacter sp.]MDK9710841.1 DUF5702 domain-containing protein [Acidaminobacter sp.]MZQ98304.1 hypothetical protein [Acidaminobacter sp.]
MDNAQIQNHKVSLNYQIRQRCVPAISLGDNGSVTLFVLLMTMTLIMLFAALVSFGTKQTRHAEMLRTLELAGQSILHTYDRRLLEAYSLLAVDLEFVEPSAYFSGPSGPNLSWKRPERTWEFEPRRSLDQPAYFMEAVRQAVAAGVADEVLNRFAGGLSAVPVLGNGDEGPVEKNASGALFEAHLSGAREERPETVDGDQAEESNGAADLTEATQEDRELAAKGIQWIRQIGKTVETGGTQDPYDHDRDRDQAQAQAQDKTLETEVQAKLISRAYLGPRAALSPSDRVPFLFYVARHFRHWVADSRAAFYIATPQPSYFKAELEYILYGYDEEAFNKARAFSEVFLMRLAGNMSHVSACREKQELIGAVAGAVNAVTGVPAPITSSALVLTWGAAESRSDLKRLLNGEALPWVHFTDEAWRTGFGDGGDEAAAATHDALKRDDLTMADYGDHLIALLAARATTSHVLRVMDLISIGDGEEGIDLSRRATRFAIHVEPDGGLPGVIWEDGYGLD